MSCQDQPLPVLYVDKTRDDALIGSFLKTKHGVLTRLLGKEEAINLYIRKDQFIQLINDMKAAPNAHGARICLASYLETTGINDLDKEVAEKDSVGKMAVVFTPTDINCVNLGPYFIISPVGRVISVSAAIAKQMIDSFRNVKIPVLNELGRIVRDDFRETESLWTNLSSLDNIPRGLIKEMNCQGATGIRLYFGAFVKGDTCKGNAVEGQLTAVFVFTRTVLTEQISYEADFDIDDTGRERKKGLGFDTLNPCPPASCPPGERNF